MNNAKYFIAALATMMGALASSASSVPQDLITVATDAEGDMQGLGEEITMPQFSSIADSLLYTVVDVDTLMSFAPLPKSFFIIPPVFNSVQYGAPDAPPFQMDYSGSQALRWIEDCVSVNRRQQGYRQYLAIHSPNAVNYNVRTLLAAPEELNVVVNPQDFTIETNLAGEKVDAVFEGPQVKKKHWLRSFRASLQFSQAYISPNWYQGGNNNLNMLLDLNYNVKLNEKFHPNYLFETNLSYKLGLNSAPDDTLRNYTISEDIFLATTTLGIKAVKKWYYTFNANFKTQLLNAYNKGTTVLRSALLAPGELNAGIGMTYGTSNKSGTCKFDASINPLSYNLMMCFNDKLNVTAFNIEEGKKTASKFGSSVECKLQWKMASNVQLNSRLFAFTDYSRGYADWENTLIFEINKFLTTQIYCHLRYDSHTPFVEEGWHNLQVKEILSMGFSYKFSTI